MTSGETGPTIRIAEAWAGGEAAGGRQPSADAVACAEIYGESVRTTVASFEVEPPSAHEIAQRIELSHLWLAAEDGEEVVGFAYGSEHRSRPAYRFAADVAVYIAAGHERRGIGRRLYSELLPGLRERGIWSACAGVTLPNPASEGLHASMGFRAVGTYRRVGWKHGRWLDVQWLQLDLRPGDSGSPE